MGRRPAANAGWKKQEEDRKELGCRRKGRERVFDFFSFFFKSFSNLFRTFLNSNLSHLLSNYFKDFSQTIFNNFSNLF
jgi:hypothetical protein